jgi:ADP-ribosylglycohydrolase
VSEVGKWSQIKAMKNRIKESLNEKELQALLKKYAEHLETTDERELSMALAANIKHGALLSTEEVITTFIQQKEMLKKLQ